MKKLTIQSFERVGTPHVLGHYFRHLTEDGRQVCLESCFSGYCVGIYDSTENIIGEKGCTNIKNFGLVNPIEILEKAVDIANEKLGYGIS